MLRYVNHPSENKITSVIFRVAVGNTSASGAGFLRFAMDRASLITSSAYPAIRASLPFLALRKLFRVASILSSLEHSPMIETLIPSKFTSPPIIQIADNATIVGKV